VLSGPVLRPQPGAAPGRREDQAGVDGGPGFAELREAAQMVIDEDGIPEQLARTLDLEVG
jgi:hypothetical protein